MNKQPGIWQFINKNLLLNIPVMLMYVMESKGSSPGRQGFGMAVNADGLMEGSIGGGIMEHKFVEMVKQKLNSGSHESSLHKQVHDKEAPRHQSGMICSGEQTILLYCMQPGDAGSIQQIASSLKNFRSGRLQLSPAGISFSDDANFIHDYLFTFHSDSEWKYEERTGYKNHLFIIGGGHCALAFSKLMSGMDYYIHLYDDRPELNTFLQNEFVHEKKIIGHYSELSEIISPGDHHYVVIMTFGYRSDDAALRALMDKKFKYLGVLGSGKKIKKMFTQYVSEGMNETLLQSIHAPIGLPVNSQTPEEIAISIAAEIIQVKNAKENTAKDRHVL